MSQVPQVTGVPPLIGNFPIPLPSLLTTDGVTIGEFGNAPLWGIYLNGVPVVVFDAFVGIDFRQGWALSDYPVENGAFETYDKVDLPYDVRVRVAAGYDDQNRQAMLETVTAISETLNFYDVVTPEVVYKNCNVQHYDYRRTNTNGAGMIIAEIWMLEIRVVPKRGADVVFPASASPISDGFVQTVIPSFLKNAILGLIT